MVSKTARRAAEKACFLSIAHAQPVGAVAFRGGSIIGIGHNFRNKTHPKSLNRYRRIHAEEDLIRKFDLNGTSVFVTRLKDDGYTMAKPCLTCQEGLRAAGAKKVFYSDWDGVVQRLW